MASVPSVKAEEAPTVTSKQANGSAAETGRASQTEKEAATTQRLYENPHPGQCGLENDGSVWYPYTVPARIKESRLTPDQRAMCQSLVDAILQTETLYGVRVAFDPEDVLEVMILVQEYLGSEPALIEDVPHGTTIVGDLHGQLYDLHRVLLVHAQDGQPDYVRAKYLFLGNYVDKGMQQLEVIMLLFCLKMLYPDNFILLRGSHEFAAINGSAGFGTECSQRYAIATAKEIFNQVNETFCYLSIAAVVGGNRYFCVSGGISPSEFTRQQMRGIRKPIIRSADDHLVHDMMWSDPADGLKGFCFNYDRGSSNFFGLDALVSALHSADCIALFRGHSLVREGFDNQWDICFTLYSYSGEKNDAAVAVVEEDGTFRVVIVPRCLKRIAWFNGILELAGIVPKNVVDNEATGEITVYQGV